MKWTPIAAGLLSVVPLTCHAAIYLTTEQAQALMFPAMSMQHIKLNITSDLNAALKKSSGMYHPFTADQVYKTANGGWFIIDKVLGKHEMITYAVGLNANGTIKQVEILEYNESYGGQVRNTTWRNQFVGKSIKDKIELNSDIQNISGATLSSKHLTDGIKRIVALHDLLLKTL